MDQEREERDRRGGGGGPEGRCTVNVAVAAPVWGALTYAVGGDLAPLIRPLTRLVVPLRHRPALAFALEAPVAETEAAPAAGLQPVSDVLDEALGPQILPPHLLGFFEKAAAHYQVPLGQALAWSLPAGLGGPKRATWTGAKTDRPVAVVHPRRGREADLPREGTAARLLLERLEESGPLPLASLRGEFPRATGLVRRLEAAGWASLSHRPLVNDILGRPIMPEPEPERLTGEQEAALAAILEPLREHRFQPILLYGVTGSGKTEVYVRACRAALEAGRRALVLTPEIGLTLRLEGLLRDRLGAGEVAVLHSGLTPAQRRGQWREAASGRARVVVGARSAIFAPLNGLGVICVDEEQDEAYKQEDRFRYHARDLALLRGREEGCPVVLGTATPAVTTYFRALRDQDPARTAGPGPMTLCRLTQRVGGAVLPRMEVVDLRGGGGGGMVEGFLSRRLMAALKETVAAGQQAVLFLNRRGFAPALLCTSCGKTIGCPSCSVSLTLHRGAGRLICHTCGHQRPLPRACPHCGAGAELLKPLGLGTEAVAEKLGELEPGWRIGRLDRDTADNPARLREFLGLVADHRLDVVVGTQMITKGHHFPRIRLVGVLLADQALGLPDYRAGERAYVQLTQAAGRAGRGENPGLVIVQTYDPEHHALRAAAAHDPEIFYGPELEERRALSYPPFNRLIGIRLEGPREEEARRAAEELARRLMEARERVEPRAAVLGPAPAPLARAQGNWRFMILLKTPGAGAGARLLRLALHLAGRPPSGVRVMVDVDPLSLI